MLVKVFEKMQAPTITVNTNGYHVEPKPEPVQAKAVEVLSQKRLVLSNKD